MPEAYLTRRSDSYLLTAAATYDAGQVFQLPTGEAAFLNSTSPVSSGEQTEKPQTSGKVTVEKTTGVVFLPGQEVWWDHSANKAHYLRTNDRDFLLGISVSGATSAAISMEVDLNKRCQAFTSLLEGASISAAATGTHAVGANGFGYPKRMGKTHVFQLSTTNESQCVDLMGIDCFAPGSKWIVEFMFKVVSGSAGSAPDVSLFVANNTHATDADSITESFGVHLNGNDVNIYLESDDGTTEVAATDSTIDYSAGSAVANRVHVLLDGRTLTDMQAYINGANVLPATTFRLDAATGPLRLLVHVEKTAAADIFELHVEEARAWYAEQGSAV